MGHIERVYTAIAHQEPDKVPKGEIMIDEALARRLLGGRRGELNPNDYLEVFNLLDIDLINVMIPKSSPVEALRVDEKGRAIYRDVWGRELIKTDFTTSFVNHPISQIEDVYNYHFPSPDQFNIKEIEWWRRNSNLFVFAQVSSGFMEGHRLLGFENYMVYCRTHKREIGYLSKKVSEVYVEVARNAIKAGAHLILIADDIAHNLGTFVSPQTLREVYFPFLAKQVEEIKKVGVPVFMHTDGDIRMVMDDLVEIGLDGLHSLQPSANMDIAWIKKRYGHRLCLMGNIDLNYLLPMGAPEEISEAVRATIKVAGPGGGYILSSCNVLTGDLPCENVLAMYRTAEICGRYPIE